MRHPEKTALIIFSTILFIGAVFLHVKRSRVSHDVAIRKDGTRRVYTLREIDKKLRESRRIPINTATRTELTLIPGIGEKFAARISEYRSVYGYFQGIQDLTAVKGIGPAKLAKMQEFVKID